MLSSPHPSKTSALLVWVGDGTEHYSLPTEFFPSTMSQPIHFCYLPLPTLFQTSPSYFVIHLHLNRLSALCEKYYYLHLADKETMDQQS